MRRLVNQRLENTKMKITPFKKYALLVAIFVTLSTLVAPALAAPTFTVTADYSFSQLSDLNSGLPLLTQHPSATTLRSGVTQTFNASVGGYLWNVTIVMWKYGPSANAVIGMQLQGTGNDLNADPNGTILETSTTTYNAFDLARDVQTNYTFQFSGTYTLQQYQAYALTVTIDSQTMQDADNHTRTGRDTSASTDEGYSGFFRDSAWDGPAEDGDLIYEVKVVNNFGGGGGTDYTFSTWDGTINSFINFMVPLIILLLPAILLMFLTRRTDKWLLIIGLAIGAGLGYYFGMVPLWLVFLVVIGLIGMAYQSVRGGGAE